MSRILHLILLLPCTSPLSTQARGLDADAAIAEGNKLKKELFASYLEVRDR